MQHLSIPDVYSQSCMGKMDRSQHLRCARSGLADPGPVAASLWTDAELHSSICLDAIITLVDAHNLQKQLHEHQPSQTVNEAERQIAYADIILLNKVNLLAIP